MLRPVEPVRDQSPIPSEKGIGFSHARDILQGFAAESFRHLSQSGPLCIRQPEPRRQVGLRMRFSAARYSLRTNNS
jgi:hypothetical protein